MILNLTRAPGQREEDDTDAPFLVNFDQVKFINRTPDYETAIVFSDGAAVNVQESMVEIMEKLGVE